MSFVILYRLLTFPAHFQGGDGASARGEVVVPRSSVGMIIGKAGETIKRLAYETGTKIQFKPDDDPNTPDRLVFSLIFSLQKSVYAVFSGYD